MDLFMSSFKTVQAAASQQDWYPSHLDNVVQMTQLPHVVRQTRCNMSVNNPWPGFVRMPCKQEDAASPVAAIQRPHISPAQNIQNSFSMFILGAVCISLEWKCIDTANKKFPSSFVTKKLQQRQSSGTNREVAVPLQVTWKNTMNWQGWNENKFHLMLWKANNSGHALIL